MKTTIYLLCLFALTIGAIQSTNAADKIELKSIGPITFGDEGTLFVSDPLAATIYAIETGDTSGKPEAAKFDTGDIKKSIAGMLGAKPDQVRILDLATNPQSGNAYLSVARGSNSIILKVDAQTGKVSEFALDDVKFTKTELPNAAESRQTRRGNARMMSITDLEFINDQVYVAGLSNEEFASNLRAIQYPFKKVSPGSSIEIYHGAHGKFETRSPVRTFAAYQIDGEMNLLAAYTCTPLVRIPVASLKDKEKVKGTTIAELGNRNRPLDMVVYKKGDSDFILMANSARGVMKVKLENVAKEEAITSRVSGGGIAGLEYDTIKAWKNITQLDGLNKTHAVVLIEEGNSATLKSVELP